MKKGRQNCQVVSLTDTMKNEARCSVSMEACERGTIFYGRNRVTFSVKNGI